MISASSLGEGDAAPYARPLHWPTLLPGLEDRGRGHGHHDRRNWAVNTTGGTWHRTHRTAKQEMQGKGRDRMVGAVCDTTP
jgi:hypothetical protein